jgi:phosphatidylglycerol:prolipoprotein diacylglycerol transferase
LLGGYLGVEWGKRLCGYEQATGDGFALVVPGALALGRIGCWVSGCCAGRACAAAWYSIVDAQGVHRYPAQLVEAGFNVAMLGAMWGLYTTGRLRGQLFHVYLIAYGGFRLAHEVWRESPRLVGPVTSYQVLAAVVLVFGVERYLRRRAELRQRRGQPQISVIDGQLQPQDEQAMHSR